jgi:uncharacterized protein YqeY
VSSELLDRLLADIKTAMKERDSQKLEALRFLHSEIKNVGINERREPTDDDVATVVAKAIKARQEVIEQSRAGGRDDIVAKEEYQMGLYRSYQPKQLSPEEVEALVDEAIRSTGASGKKEMGKVMKELMPKVKGRADGKLVNTIVSQKLA